MTASRNDTSLTLDDLILRVAEASGIADYSGDVAAVPTSPHDYDLCRRAVNDGIEMIYRASPKWRFLNQRVSFVMATDGTHPWAVENDPARYVLPWFVSGNPIDACLTLTGSGSTTYSVPIINMRLVRDARSQNDSSAGAPQIAAIERLASMSMNGRSAWELVFYPDPDYTYTVAATFRCFAPKLVGRGDRHVMGAEHDQTVIAAAIYAKKLTDSKDPIERENYRQAYQTALAESIRLDEHMSPRSLGVMTDPSVCDGDVPYDIGDRTGMTMTMGVPS